MKAAVGDYIRFNDPETGLVVVSKVVGLNTVLTQYHRTEDGYFISERDLGIDDVLLASEVEVG